MPINFNRLHQALGGRLTEAMMEKLKKLDKLDKLDDKALHAEIHKICPGLPEGVWCQNDRKLDDHFRGQLCMVRGGNQNINQIASQLLRASGNDPELKNDLKAFLDQGKDFSTQSGNTAAVNSYMAGIIKLFAGLPNGVRDVLLSLKDGSKDAFDRAVAADKKLTPEYNEVMARISTDQNQIASLTNDQNRVIKNMASTQKEIKALQNKPRLNAQEQAKLATLQAQLKELEKKRDALSAQISTLNDSIQKNQALAATIEPNCVKSFLNTFSDAIRAMAKNPDQADDIKALTLNAFNAVGQLSSTKGVKNALMALDNSFPTMAANLPSSDKPYGLNGFQTNMKYLFETYFPGNLSADKISEQLDGISKNFSTLTKYTDNTLQKAVLATNNGASVDQNRYTDLLSDELVAQLGGEGAIRSGLTSMQLMATSPTFFMDNGNVQTVLATLRTVDGKSVPNQYAMTLSPTSVDNTGKMSFGDGSITRLDAQTPGDVGLAAIKAARNGSYKDLPVFPQLEIIDKMTSDTLPDNIKFALSEQLENRSLTDVVENVILPGADHATMFLYQTALSRSTNTAKLDPNGFAAYRFGMLTLDQTQPLNPVDTTKLGLAFREMVNSGEFRARIGQAPPNGVNPDLASEQPDLLIAALAQTVLGRPPSSFETEAWTQAYYPQGDPAGFGQLLALVQKSPEVVVRTFLQNTALRSDTGFYQEVVDKMRNGMSTVDAFNYVQQRLA